MEHSRGAPELTASRAKELLIEIIAALDSKKEAKSVESQREIRSVGNRRRKEQKGQEVDLKSKVEIEHAVDDETIIGGISDSLKTASIPMAKYGFQYDQEGLFFIDFMNSMQQLVLLDPEITKLLSTLKKTFFAV
mmetsp:Transcript_11853/g.15502  ORF Transcript_11853/g.15502 Transcript_11853/m.15502 type:complete len:135 (-) Transcript_11853:559-963(-)|eukprot:CAMPEP_0117744256 /NCGR_PEP_ID=MMETSP0947-20121206/6643_1 /TAXON_ID=44440 /ORGANISM="Chattonella subsalsa, Strain CCMP2191" /LENGTH=134 /DNA_ID=CAMNT_0005561155 /DNA_START=85 /DNA_END=489 /DNA_ORIENTATION=+